MPFTFAAWLVWLWLFCCCWAAPVEDEGKCTSEDEKTVTTTTTDRCNPSQTAVAMEMARLSSPRALQKLQRMLNQYRYFHLDLGGSQGVFDGVGENVREALLGYGLQETESYNADDVDAILGVETFFSPSRSAQSMESRAILFLQTEQICCSLYGQLGLGYLQLCHASPHCIVWEYSQTNWAFLEEQGLADSVLLLPFLHQHRLDHYYPSSQVTGLEQRPIDVVFFGVMTERRKQIQQQLSAIVENHQLKWNVLLQEVDNSGSKLQYMAEKYLDAKICLILHGFGDKTPGEYHRLSELSGSGCLPLVETFGDTVGIETYQLCGGVVFADLQRMPALIQTLLQTISSSPARESFQMNRRLAWWKDRIQWRHLLTFILENGGTTIGNTVNEESMPDGVILG